MEKKNMTKIIFSILSYVPLGGLIFFYSFYGVLLLTHADVSSWMSQNPEVIGGSLANWFFPVLLLSTLVLILSLVYHIVARMLGDTSNFTSKNVVVMLSTGLLQFLMMAYDPGHYIIWLFD